MNINAIKGLEVINRHIYKTVNYDRKIGVLLKSDYLFISDLLERQLEVMQSLDIDNHKEIDRLKILFIKLEHQIQQFR